MFSKFEGTFTIWIEPKKKMHASFADGSFASEKYFGYIFCFDEAV